MILALDKGLIGHSITDEDILSVKLIKAVQFMVLVGHKTGNGAWAEGGGDWAYDVNTHILDALAKEVGCSSVHEFLKSNRGIELNYILMSFGMFSVYDLGRRVFSIQKEDSDVLYLRFGESIEYIDFTRIRESACKSKVCLNENLISFCENMYKERLDADSLRDKSFDRRCKYVLDNIIDNNIVKNCAIDIFTENFKTYDDISIKDILLKSLEKRSVSKYVSSENIAALRAFANNL